MNPRIALVALALAAPAPAPPAAACEPPLPAMYVDDLTLTFRPERTTYRRGQAALVRVTARRRDPVPAAAAPVAADVDLRLRTPGGSEVGRIVFTLPASGERVGRWRIPEGIRTGQVNVTVVALHQLVPSTECYGSLVYERGAGAQERYLTVTR